MDRNVYKPAGDKVAADMVNVIKSLTIGERLSHNGSRVSLTWDELQAILSQAFVAGAAAADKANGR